MIERCAARFAEINGDNRIEIPTAKELSERSIP
jgi:hypothetical protein